MEQIWDWGLSVIKAIQVTTCKPLDWLAFFIHYVCNTPIYLFFIALYCWCIDYKKGFKIGTTVIVSCQFNSTLKNLIRAPRPFLRDNSVFRIEESGFSTPSGHSQTSSTFFPLLAEQVKKGVLLKVLIAIVIPILIGCSRMYLGVHYPTDVIFGLLLGYVFAILGIFCGKKIESLFLKLPRKSIKVLVIAIISFIFIIICREDTSMAGAFFGFVTGYIMMGDKKFDATEGTLWQKILRLLVGLVLVGIFYFVLKMVFPPKEAPWGQFCRFVRYGICGFIITFGSPKLFVLIKLGKINKFV